jgi:hypothetical protein
VLGTGEAGQCLRMCGTVGVPSPPASRSLNHAYVRDIGVADSHLLVTRPEGTNHTTTTALAGVSAHTILEKLVGFA